MRRQIWLLEHQNPDKTTAGHIKTKSPGSVRVSVAAEYSAASAITRYRKQYLSCDVSSVLAEASLCSLPLVGPGSSLGPN